MNIKETIIEPPIVSRRLTNPLIMLSWVGGESRISLLLNNVLMTNVMITVPRRINGVNSLNLLFIMFLLPSHMYLDRHI